MTQGPATPSNPASADVRCRIAPSAIIGMDVQLGEDVDVGAGAIVLGPCSIGDRCVIAAGCILDPGAGPTGSRLVLETDVKLLAGVTIAGRVAVGRDATVQAGTTVQRAIPPHAIVAGNPAQITGYTLSGTAAQAIVPEYAVSDAPSRVRGVSLHHLPRILDLRGNLTVGEFGRLIPFVPKRYFMVFGVPNAEIRGEHAHRICQQFLLCAHGSCHVVADDGEHREEFTLDDPAVGLYLPAMTWGIQYKYSPDAVLVAFASEYYDNSDYIRDYAKFLALTAGTNR